MTRPGPSQGGVAAVSAAGLRHPDREGERLVALHRVSTLVAQQRRTDDVLREALQSAVSLVGADAGAIHEWCAERQLLRCVVAHGRHEAIITSELRPGEGLTGHAFVQQAAIIENEYTTSPLGTQRSREAGLHTGMAIPIAHGVHCLGILSVGSYDPGRTFDAEDARLLELFAAMVAVALENAALNARLEDRVERIRRLSRLTRFTATCLDVEHILPRIARAAVELTGAHFATFWMADEAERTLTLGGTADDTLADGLERRTISYGQGASGWVAQHRQALTIDDVFADGRSINLDWWQRSGMRTSLTLPVLHGTRLLAILSLAGREPFRLSETEMEVLESFLAQAAAAIRNASLYSTVRRSQEQLQQIVDHSPAAISLKDRDGRYLLTNRRWQALVSWEPGCSSEGAVGRTVDELFPPVRAERTRQRDRIVLSDGRTVEYEATVGEGAEQRTYLSVKFPLTDAAAQPYAVCTISTDITERKCWEEEIAAALSAQRAANEQLERLNRAKSDFVSIVSHEFRSPLTGIQGFSELMRDGSLDADEMREYAADITREAERLSRMIDELLDLDRMESGRMTLNLGAVDLGALATRLVTSAAQRARRHRLGVKLSADLPLLTGDADKLTQVIVNLLDNAIKYSPDGGKVLVGVSRAGQAVHLWVRDDGLGIPPDKLEHVFERYTRLGSGQHSSIHGTGLGLPIVRQIVELHGGRAWAESTPGQGSVFHVSLPLDGPAASDEDGHAAS